MPQIRIPPPEREGWMENPPEGYEERSSLLDILGKILEPKYEIPGLSSYTRAVGTAKEILDAPITKRKEEFAKTAGIDVGDVPEAIGGGVPLSYLLGGTLGAGQFSGLSSMYVTPGDIPGALAPASGDPESGLYSPLDVGFAIVDVATLGASKAIRGIGRKVLDDFSDVVKSSRTRKFEKQAASEVDVPGTPSGSPREEALSRGMPIDVETGVVPESYTPPWSLEPSHPDYQPFLPSAVEKQRLIESGVFKTTGMEELSDLEDLALEGGAFRGVKLLPSKGKFKTLDVSNIEDETAVIVRRSKATGHDINRDILIGRKQLGSTDQIKMASIDPKTSEAMTELKFDLDNIGGKKLLKDIEFFQVGGASSKGVARMHSGKMMNDFIANVLRNDWIITPQAGPYTFDSLMGLIKRSVRNKMQMIFEPNIYRMESSGGSYLRWKKLSFTAMVNEKGEFVEEGLDTVIKELEDQIQLAREYGGVVGDPKIQKAGERALTRAKLTPTARKKIIQKHGDQRGKEVIDEMISEYGALKTEKKFRGHTSITYGQITIKKLKSMLAVILGMSSAKEFDEFLNYNPSSMEAQVFDNELMF